MNMLTTAKRVQIVAALVEGCSMRSTARMAGVSINTVTKLMVDMGRVCQRFHDDTARNLRAERVQADEAWAFCYAKDRNVPASMQGMDGVGSVWTWTALDADTKLMISWHVGTREQEDAVEFMLDVASRVLTRIQLTTDGHNAYPKAVWEAFGTEIDYAQLIKTYGAPRDAEARYSPAVCTGSFTMPRCGRPIEKDISTSHVERSNLTLRMGQRRYTRLTNAFSKKFENLCHSVALFFTFYNFCRVHKTLRVTPAMEAGIADHVWTLEELVGLLEAEERAVIGTEKNRRGPYRKSKDSE
jgi:IS1 family transposase/lambda repressor-like predicted transcriptional regulator